MRNATLKRLSVIIGLAATTTAVFLIGAAPMLGWWLVWRGGW